MQAGNWMNWSQRKSWVMFGMGRGSVLQKAMDTLSIRLSDRRPLAQIFVRPGGGLTKSWQRAGCSTICVVGAVPESDTFWVFCVACDCCYYAPANPALLAAKRIQGQWEEVQLREAAEHCPHIDAATGYYWADRRIAQARHEEKRERWEMEQRK